jgi:hypothetical protein
MGAWFVEQRTRRILLHDHTEENPSWIEVKDELSDGEQKSISIAAFNAQIDVAQEIGLEPKAEASIRINFDMLVIARTKVWLVKWSAADEKGRMIPITIQSVKNLTKDRAKEIEKALDQHIADMDKLKNNPDGGKLGSSISPSVTS